MKRDSQTTHSWRRSRRTVYVVTGFYVTVGIALAAGAAMAGDRLSAFLGFLIVTGALVAAAVLGTLLKMAAMLAQATAGLSTLRDDVATSRAALSRFEALASPGLPPAVDAGEPQAGLERPGGSAARQLDLAAVGRGDPAVLVAARLDRDSFPRLVRTMDEEPPARADLTAGNRALQDDTPVTFSVTDHAPAGRNLLEEWRRALKQRDLATCRRVLSVLQGTADDGAVANLRNQLDALSDRLRAGLVADFRARLKAGDFAGALAVGDRLAAMFRGDELETEVNKLRPHLLRRIRAIAPAAPAEARARTS